MIKVLSYFYLCLIFFYSFPIFIFSTKTVILGRIIDPVLTKTIHVFFIIFFYFLYTAMRDLKRAGLRLAVFLHLVFLFNSILILSGRTPILDIRGLKTGVYACEHLIALGSIFINILIIFYLLRKNSYFVDKR